MLILKSPFPLTPLSFWYFSKVQSYQQEAADTLPDGQLRAAEQAVGGCGREGQSQRSQVVKGLEKECVGSQTVQGEQV